MDTKKKTKVETKKKDKSVWKEVGNAVVAIGGLAVTILLAKNKK